MANKPRNATMAKEFNPIITAALTGGYHSKATVPTLPEQPDEIVEQGIAAWEAGAAVLHIHARNPDGTNTSDVEIYREIHTRLCGDTDAIIQLTTGGGLQPNFAERLGPALINPEMASLNMGHVLFFMPDGSARMLDNPRAQIEWFAKEMAARQVKPELEIYSLTMIEEAERLIESGLLEPPFNVGLVLGAPGQGAYAATLQNLAESLRRLPAGVNVDVIAIGRSQLPLTTIGLAAGLNIRVGLEDNARYSRGEFARDNAQLVERAVRIARELQLTPATPDEAREILGTRGREHGRLPIPVVADERPVTPPPV